MQASGSTRLGLRVWCSPKEAVSLLTLLPNKPCYFLIAKKKKKSGGQGEIQKQRSD